MNQEAISILGAGSWGTALALQAARNGCPTLLWGHNATHIQTLTQQKENKRYLPGQPFPETLTLSHDLKAAVDFSSILLISVPSHAFKDTLNKIKPLINNKTNIAWSTKGFNSHDGCLLNDLVNQILSDKIPTAVLSGPTFAKEVGEGYPTAITIASNHKILSGKLSEILHNQFFRTYTSHDMIGVQVGGAVKNVLAIAAGIADGLGFGANSRAALISRGLQEIIRLGKSMGGEADTFMGLAGLGDLILTCTDNQSRNRRFGLAIGEGKNREQAMIEIAQEIEGISAARETYLLSKQHNVEMPIVEQTYQVLYEDLHPKIAVQNLLARQQKPENSFS